MKSFVITLKEDRISERAADVCRSSADFDIETFDAITPEQANDYLRSNNIKWTYPITGEVSDFKSGLKLTAYTGADPLKRIACFASHYELWKRCVYLDEPILILEHDAIFVKKINFQCILSSIFGIISINDPRGATRKSREYHEKIQSCEKDICHVPSVDDFMVPQGLPGNSAYIIKPEAAINLIDAVNYYGAWPNDAIMCKQLIPRLGASKTYYTKVQGTPSTTTL